VKRQRDAVQARRILLIVGGGIAAYKACELIRLLRRSGFAVRCVLTDGGAQFVTPMTLAALSEQPVHTSLWDLKDEVEMGHIQLSREADLIVVCPATADLLARMAAGIANDLATTLLLATDKPVLAAPAMNVRMWRHEATQRNVARLRADGVAILDPDEGEMACGEFGPGRLPEPEAIMRAVESHPALSGPAAPRRLTGRHFIVTAGPTHEPIDPVRVIANRSSGKQGFAVAEALAALGARVTLVAGPVALPTPPGSSGSTSRRRVRWTGQSTPLSPPTRPCSSRRSPIGESRPRPPSSRSPGARRSSSGRPIPTFSSPSPRAATGRSSSSASPPKRTTYSPRRSGSASARAATGSSPTTSPAA
jgi:phosphopantothenoylcysteine synthetase/decarboxylase